MKKTVLVIGGSKGIGFASAKKFLENNFHVIITGRNVERLTTASKELHNCPYITLRVPHLSWVSMKGEAKRDYPATIHYQSSWYREYQYVENHYARLNTALTRGTPVVKVAVIHPIETYWLHWGSRENTYDIRNMLNEQFGQTVEWMLSGLIDFDYLCESLLPEQIGNISEQLSVGQMYYSAIVVSGCETLRSTTVEILEKFHQAGGKIIFVGESPKYVDAIVSDRVRKLYDKFTVIMHGKSQLLGALNEHRCIDIKNPTGERTNNLLYQLRQDTDGLWLFIAHNVLLLDIGKYKIDQSEYCEPEEIRQIHNICCEKLHFLNNSTQPWKIQKEKPAHFVTIKYEFASEIDLSEAYVATEDYNVCKIVFNSHEVPTEVVGYFADKSIGKIKIPGIKKGINTMEITYPFGTRTSLENCFILGDFNVKCEGTTKTIIPKTDTVGFGDIVPQGLSFYGANITYEMEFEAPETCDAIINVSNYIGAVVKIKLDAT